MRILVEVLSVLVAGVDSWHMEWLNDVNDVFQQLDKVPLADYRPAPEVDMNVTELIIYNGFDPEVYNVETSDGYILELFRIRGDKDAYLR